MIKDYKDWLMYYHDYYMNSLKLTWLGRFLLGGENKYHALANVIMNIENLFNCGRLYVGIVYKT
jgi:hypothetical protein